MNRKLKKKGEGKYVTRAKYHALSKVDLNFHTGDSTADLVELSPVDLTFASEVPPPARLLATRNLDFGIEEGLVPEIRYKARREQIVSEKGTTHKRPQSKGSRPRGTRDLVRRR